MSNQSTNPESDFLSPKEMQGWASQEVRDAAKAHELRASSAFDIATGFALGELTPEQAHERYLRHQHRWGDALPGTYAFQGSTDEQILAAIDKTRGEFDDPAKLAEGFQNKFGNRKDRGGPQSR